MSTVCDQAQDLNGQEFHRLTALFGCPKFVKNASISEYCGDEQTESHMFADITKRRWPCHTAPATWASALFFLDFLGIKMLPDHHQSLLGNLLESLNKVNSIGTRFMQPLKDCEFLSSIKQRSSIPGGTCEFDLPEYNHWLRQPFARRQQDLQGWLNVIRPVCDTVIELLWLIRESVQPVEKTAINGMYQHKIQKRMKRRLLRITLPIDSQLYPEISASQHRFTVRFLEWSNIGHRAIQTEYDVQFQISTC